MPQVPVYANLSATDEINYLCNINSDLNFNCKYVRDRKVIVLRNCDTSGNLIDLKTSAKYLSNKPWVLLIVREFSINSQKTPVPICKECNDSVEFLSTNLSLELLSQHLCIHSRVSANLIRDFDTAWHLDGALNLSPYDDEKDRVEIFHCRENSSVRSQTLALVFRKQKISLIYSSGRQITPSCSSCTAKQCILWLWKFENDRHVASKNDSPINTNKEPVHYFLQESHYHNNTPIVYPLQNCPHQREIIEAKEEGSFCLPYDIIPIYDDNNVCKEHGNRFIADDSGLGTSQ